MRYLVVDPGSWLVDNAVPISPMAITRLDVDRSHFELDPRSSPRAQPAPADRAWRDEKADETHLRSASEVTGYHIRALDGEVGHVDDFLLDDESWTIRYFIVDTSNWIGGRAVLISPDWVRRVDWPLRQVHVDVAADVIRNSPEYNPAVELTREQEARLHAHYGHAGYWDREAGQRRTP